MSGTGSSFPITRLASKKNEMMRDGLLLSNRKSVEILDRRLMELLERIDTNQAPNRLGKLFKLWGKYMALLNNGRDVEAIVKRKEIDAEFEAGYHDYAAWKQMFDVLDLRRKMVESEVKIAKDMHAVLTAEDAYDMVADIFAAILRISGQFDLDPQVLKAFQYEFTRIIGEEPVGTSGETGRDTIDIE